MTVAPPSSGGRQESDGLRRAAPSDRDVLLRFMECFYQEEGICFTREAANSALDELHATPALGSVYLVEEGIQTVGYIVLIYSFILEFGGRQAYIDELFIAEEYRGRGVAAQALQSVTAFCRAQQIGVIRLEVSRQNAAALRLYSRAGFVQHDRCTMTKLVTRECT